MALELDNIVCFICPIGQDVMGDPVITPSGQSYERVNIEAWLQNNPTDPMTREPLTVNQLIPNLNLREAVTAWQQLDSDWRNNVNALQAELVQEQNARHEAEALAQENQNNMSAESPKMKTLRDRINFIQYRMQANVRRQNKPRMQAASGKLVALLTMIPEKFQGNVRNRIYNGLVESFNDNGLLAREMFEEIIRQEPEDDWLMLQLGIAFHKIANEDGNSNNYQQAIECYRMAIDINPENDEAHRWWGWALDRISKYESEQQKEILLREALEHYTHALTINPENVEAYENQGRALRSLGKEAAALESFLEVIRLDKSHVKALIAVGETLKKQNDFEGALHYFTLATQHGPQDEIAWYKFGKCYLDRHKHIPRQENQAKIDCLNAAVEAFKRSIEVNPKYDRVYVDYGFCLTRLGKDNYPEAKQLYETALRINPHNDLAQRNLDWVNDQMRPRGHYSTRNRWRQQGGGRRRDQQFFQQRGGNNWRDHSERSADNSNYQPRSNR